MLFTRMGRECRVVGLALATGRSSPAILLVEYADDLSSREVAACDLRAEGGAAEIEAALIAACGRDLTGRTVAQCCEQSRE